MPKKRNGPTCAQLAAEVDAAYANVLAIDVSIATTESQIAQLKASVLLTDPLAPNPLNVANIQQRLAQLAAQMPPNVALMQLYQLLLAVLFSLASLQQQRNVAVSIWNQKVLAYEQAGCPPR